VTRVLVTPAGWSRDGSPCRWRQFADSEDPLKAAVAAFVGARNPRLARLDRAAHSALLAAHVATYRAPVPDSLVVAVEEGCDGPDGAFWETARSGGGAGASPVLFTATLPSALAGEIAMTFGLRGPSLVFGRPAPSSAEVADLVFRGVCLEVRLRGWDGDEGETIATLHRLG
jgi:3-oxoacyl-(acyl-carrier-protein) synthase